MVFGRSITQMMSTALRINAKCTRTANAGIINRITTTNTINHISSSKFLSTIACSNLQVSTHPSLFANYNQFHLQSQSFTHSATVFNEQLEEEPATTVATKPSPAGFVQRLFTVVQIGGKQYKVTEGDKIVLNRLHAEIGRTIVLQKVLLVGSSSWTAIGTPLVGSEAVTVRAVVEDHHRGAKIQVFKKKRRKGYARRQGHRQELTTLRISEIDCAGPQK